MAWIIRRTIATFGTSAFWTGDGRKVSAAKAPRGLKVRPHPIRGYFRSGFTARNTVPDTITAPSAVG